MGEYEDPGLKIAKTALKITWCAFLTLGLITIFLDGALWDRNMAVFAQINFWMILQNIGIIALVILAAVGLFKLNPKFFGWSWFALFNKREDGQYSGINVAIIPAQVKYFGLFFIILLALNLPHLAEIEEKMFRLDTMNWMDGIINSIIFGLVHCLVGVPICAGIAISISGLWYTHQYFLGGVAQSALHHTTYNLIIVAILFIGMLIVHIHSLTQTKKVPS